MVEYRSRRKCVTPASSTPRHGEVCSLEPQRRLAGGQRGYEIQVQGEDLAGGSQTEGVGRTEVESRPWMLGLWI